MEKGIRWLNINCRIKTKRGNQSFDALCCCKGTPIDYSHKTLTEKFQPFSQNELPPVWLFRFLFISFIFKRRFSASVKQSSVMTVCPRQHFCSSSLFPARSGTVVHRWLVIFSVSWRLEHNTRPAATHLVCRLSPFRCQSVWVNMNMFA